MGEIDEDLKDVVRKAENTTEDTVVMTNVVGGRVAGKAGTEGIVEEGREASDWSFTKAEDVTGEPLDKIADAGSSLADAIEEAADNGITALKRDLEKI